MEGKLEILIVGNDVGLTSKLQDILEAEGYTTAVAHDGHIAISIYREKVFDLAIVDIKLPDMLGMELTRQLNELQPEVGYIIITGYASLDNAIEAVEMEKIIAYETKPIDMNHFLALIKQVAEHKHTELALRQERNRAQKYLDMAGVMLVAIDADQRVSLINRRGCQVLGYKEDEVIGKNWFVNFLPERFGDEVKAVFDRLIGGEAEAIEYFENPILTKNGKERIIAWHNIVLTDEQSNIIGTLSSGDDITEAKQVEKKITQAAKEWRTTFDSITDLVSIHDKNFRITRVNKAFADTFNMRPKELIGKLCYEIVHGTNEPVPNCPHKKAMEHKKPAMGQFFEPSVGIHLEVSTSPIFNEKGEVVASVHVARDITERKKMEEQLIVTDRLASLGELASGIAHELNNPLTAVIGFSDLLLEKDLPDYVKEDLTVINREAKRTSRIVRNLLTFARKHPEEKQAVDINNLIENVLEIRAYQQKVNNIEVNTQLITDLPEIMASHFELQQVFVNIVINAEHFMIEAHNRGTLTITTERTGEIVKVSFADDGPGIAKENLRHLFNPFFTTKEVGKGTGLGLSICHGIISRCGGRIYAESELGKGATFVVELPITIDREGAVK
ncbi:MAG TPA: PAS domain S-box protein [Dehalococcoidia bacterium]|nr:PAS domain S-box protein [Dehalococcoidia bacterium]